MDGYFKNIRIFAKIPDIFRKCDKNEVFSHFLAELFAYINKK